MKRMIWIVLLVAACKTPVDTTRKLEIPKDSSTVCTTQCQSIGLALSSVVIMANHVGCVCAPAPTPAPAASSGAAAGLIAILLQRGMPVAQTPIGSTLAR